MTFAYVGLGSNLDDPVAQLDVAVDALGALPDTRVSAVSSYYRSAPLGPADQPDFVNAVAELQTSLTAAGLLRDLLAIERARGRIRGERWGPRVLDLDLLVFGDSVSVAASLQLPHPGIIERNFVLLPLQEIAPELEIPGIGRVADIAVDPAPRITRID